ncbi:MAG: AAA family ATPase [Candidatus Methanomethylophilaceae archaeon]|jgi:predicted cytidylate kinase
MRITISGPPGSGKTTTCKMLSEELDLKAVVFGQFFREMAAERGLTLGEFGALAENDSTIDKTIDSKILEVARANSDIILESRLSAYMLTRNGIPAFRIYLSASPEVRMARVGVREGESLDDAVRKTIERQASEAKRYKMYYDIDIDDLSVYDLVISTDHLNPDQVTAKILDALKECKC